MAPMKPLLPESVQQKDLGACESICLALILIPWTFHSMRCRIGSMALFDRPLAICATPGKVAARVTSCMLFRCGWALL